MATDLAAAPDESVVACDLRKPEEVARLFEVRPITTVIHLAGVLPSAFRADPVTGAEVNLGGAVNLLNAAVSAGAKRFVFASSMSVYGSAPSARLLTEDDPAVPDDPYGASKRAIELVGEAMDDQGAIEFVALRIARIVGPGIKQSVSLWRSQIFDLGARDTAIQIPFGGEAKLSLVHVRDVAGMLITLAHADKPKHRIYNSPVEIIKAAQLQALVEKNIGRRVELGSSGLHAGPTGDGSRFASEFGFHPRGLASYLSESGHAAAD